MKAHPILTSNIAVADLLDNGVTPEQMHSEALPFPFFFTQSTKAWIGKRRAIPLEKQEWHRNW